MDLKSQKLGYGHQDHSQMIHESYEISKSSVEKHKDSNQIEPAKIDSNAMPQSIRFLNFNLENSNKGEINN